MSRKIAIIEDDDILLKALSQTLTDNKYEVITAIDGKSGLELIRNDSPDLILLDIVMPTMTGTEMYERMQKEERLAGIPVIFLTNLDDIDKKKQVLNEGAVDYFVKSNTDLDFLLEKVGKILK